MFLTVMCTLSIHISYVMWQYVLDGNVYSLYPQIVCYVTVCSWRQCVLSLSTDRMLCDSNFLDSRGYAYNCHVKLTEDEVDEFYPFSCRFDSKETTLLQTFTLPDCERADSKCCIIPSWDFIVKDPPSVFILIVAD